MKEDILKNKGKNYFLIERNEVFGAYLQISLDGKCTLVTQSLEYCRHLYLPVVGNQVPISHLDGCISAGSSCKSE